MIVTCPACSTRYLVDPRALGSAGRTVRCANCANTWHQEPAEDLPRTLEVTPDEFGPRPSSGRYPPPALATKSRPWATYIAAGLLAVIVSGAVAGVLARDRVATMWPPAARLFSLVGLSVPPPNAGLKLDSVSPHRDIENGVPVLIVEGVVKNIGSVARDIPKIKVVLRDSGGNNVQSAIFAATEPRVLPGAGVPFRATIVQPSSSATDISVDFAEGG
jgi:predicted Zn finger-like uncharacterized protein